MLDWKEVCYLGKDSGGWYNNEAPGASASAAGHRTSQGLPGLGPFTSDFLLFASWRSLDA